MMIWGMFYNICRGHDEVVSFLFANSVTKWAPGIFCPSQTFFHVQSLGKTVQAIAVLLALKEAEYLDESPALVVCPTSLLSNWKRELSKFAPSLSIKICRGPDRARVFKAAVGSKRKRYSGPDVLLVSYGSARQDVVMLCKAEYSLMIIDESQSLLGRNFLFLIHGLLVFVSHGILF